MISKQDFNKIINLLIKYNKKEDKINELLKHINNGKTNFTYIGEELYKVIDILFSTIFCEDVVETVYWWLYEDVDKYIYYSNNIIINDLRTIDALYDYCIELNIKDDHVH